MTNDDPNADYTIRATLGGAAQIIARNGVIAATATPIAVALFIAGAAAAGKSVYDRRSGKFLSGTVEQLDDILRGLS